MDDPRLAPPLLPDTIPDLDTLQEEALTFADGSKAEATRKAYAASWSNFVAWCKKHGREPLPASANTVSLYLTHGARSSKTSTLEMRLVSIAHHHRARGLQSPTEHLEVRSVWNGIKRELGCSKSKKRATLTKLMRALVSALPQTLSGARDRAILLLGYAGAMRRGEIVSLDMADLERVDEGFIVTIRKSKTDQVGRGRKIGIPFGTYEETCPVRSIERWRQLSGIDAGPLFRAINRHGQLQAGRLTDQTVAAIVKRTLTKIGIDPADYAGHSLRSGFVTMAALGGSKERELQRQTGHKDLSVLRGYIQDAELFRNNPARKLGL